METKKLLKALGGLKVETGSLACLGCEYENQCSTKGCAIIREAYAVIAQLERTETVIRAIVDGEDENGKRGKICKLSEEQMPKYVIPVLVRRKNYEETKRRHENRDIKIKD